MSRLLIILANRFFSILDSTCAVFGRTTVPRVGLEDVRSCDSDSNVVLLDVRTPAETEISVIPGAVTKEAFEANREQYRDRRIIAYCTVGGRSYLYAQRLRKAGFDAANFQASILGWCEANGKLVAPDGAETKRVHVYSGVFRVPDDYEAVS